MPSMSVDEWARATRLPPRFRVHDHVGLLLQPKHAFSPYYSTPYFIYLCSFTHLLNLDRHSSAQEESLRLHAFTGSFGHHSIEAMSHTHAYAYALDRSSQLLLSLSVSLPVSGPYPSRSRGELRRPSSSFLCVRGELLRAAWVHRGHGRRSYCQKRENYPSRTILFHDSGG